MKVTTNDLAGQRRNDSSDEPDQASIERDERISQAVAEFLAGVEVGHADRSALLAKYADVAEELEGCLQTFDFVNNIAPQLTAPSAVGPREASPQFKPLATLGDFRILHEIGRGGMGVVYEAEQLSLRRKVALKVLPFAALLDARQLERFKNEARSAAALSHPHIVGVHFVGCDRGVHYYAMELIEGYSLSQVLETRHPPSEHVTVEPYSAGEVSDAASTQSIAAQVTRINSGAAPKRYHHIAALGVQAAQALDYAHKVGIVHRDIKPSNLLIDTHGKLWVADFGLAMTHADSSLTISGDLVGTLRYMSPEQASGRSGVVDHRTDIYSLGLTLYELITCQPAFAGNDRQQLLHQVLEKSPPPPRTINAAIPRDLETIVLKATAKESYDRYETAQALADDLSRFIRYQPIRARRSRRAEHAWRWCRRNPATASLVAAVGLLLLVLGISGPLVALKYKHLLMREAAAHQDSITQAKRYHQRRYVAEVNSAYDAWQVGNWKKFDSLLQRQMPAPGEGDLRGFLWHHLWNRYQESLRLPSLAQGSDVHCVEFSPDGNALAVGCLNGQVKLWDLSRRKLCATLHSDPAVPLFDLAFSSDGKLLAAHGSEKQLLVWDLDTRSGRRVATGHTRHLDGVAFRPGTRTLATCSADGTVRLVDLDTGSLLQTFDHGGKVRDIAFSPDGTRLGSCDWSGKVYIRKLSSDELPAALDGHTSTAHTVHFSRDGKTLASTGEDGLWLWNVADGSGRRVVATSHESYSILAGRLSDDSKLFAGSCTDGTVRVWDLGTATLLETIIGHLPSFGDHRVAFVPGETTVVYSGVQEDIRLFDIDVKSSVTRRRDTHWTTVSFGPLDRILVSTMGYGSFRTGQTCFWDLLTGTCRFPFTEQVPRRMCTAALSPDGTALATAHFFQQEPAEFRLWRAGSGELQQKWQTEDPIRWAIVEFSPNGQYVAAGSHGVKVWRVEDGMLHHDFSDPQFQVASLKFISAGDVLVAGGSFDTGGLRAWDMQTGQLIAKLDDDRVITCIDESPKEPVLALAHWDSTVQLWDYRNRRLRDKLTGHSATATGVSFSADGKLLASGSFDRTVKLWHMDTLAELATLKTGCAVTDVAFSADGETLAAGLRNATVKLWHMDGRIREFSLPENDESTHFDTIMRANQ